jgi:predicted metallopeptidase
MTNIIILFLCLVILPAVQSQNIDSIHTLLSNGKRDYAFYHQLLKVKDSTTLENSQELYF